MYYICKKCGEKFGTTKPLEHGYVYLTVWPERPRKHKVCDGEILELTYEEYTER